MKTKTLDSNHIIYRTLRMPDELADKLTELGKRKGIPVNSLILSILWNHVETGMKGPGEATYER